MLRVVSTREIYQKFTQEAGGHRWQRVPPTERHGRRHTSTVTVAIIPEREGAPVIISKQDIEEFVARGSGPGGQHRNKTESCVTIRHKDTGIQAKVDMRSQHRSRAMAMDVLKDRVEAHLSTKIQQSLQQDRQAQVGSGMRGDKIRTYRQQDNLVSDHRTGKRARLSDIMRGGLPALWAN